MDEKQLWKIKGGGMTVYILSTSMEKAKHEAVKMIWEGERPLDRGYEDYLDSLQVRLLIYVEID